MDAAKLFTRIWRNLALSSGMFRVAVGIAVGLIGIYFPVAAQQPKQSRVTHHRVAAPAVVPPLNAASNLSIYPPSVVSASTDSLLFRNGPLRAWSDGGQLASQAALAQIGAAPLGLFPAAYLAPGYSESQPVQNSQGTFISHPKEIAADGKDLDKEMISSPLNPVYYTGEVGFMYGHSMGKGSSDYLESYVWGQAGNDKFQITAGAAFQNWGGSSGKIRAYSFSR